MKSTIGNFGKYGDLIKAPTAYTVKPRHDLLSLIPKRSYNSLIEFGCADGSNLVYFGDKLGIKNLVGVDVCKSDVVHKEFLFHHQTAENFIENNRNKYDLVLMSDVLEHIYNPWEIVKALRNVITANGVLVISVPNVQNIRYIQKIISGDFFYEQSGLMDQTHIRFFSKKTITYYLTSLGYKILSVAYRDDPSISRIRDKIKREVASGKPVTLQMGTCAVSIDKDNLNESFGQQILISCTVLGSG